METRTVHRRARELGATAIEYALIVGILAVVLIAAFTALGGGIDETFTDILNTITGGGGGDGDG